jgi:hypothetical protein
MFLLLIGTKNGELTIRSAKEEINLVDHNIDESTLLHLAKKQQAVKVLFYSKLNGKQFQLDLEKAKQQYGVFVLRTFTKSHDRFLIIDRQEIYHLGASLKDLGKNWFAFSRLGISVAGISDYAVGKSIG